MIACLSVPYFAAAVERRDDDSLTAEPLAIGGQPWEAKPVYAFSQEVARQGVHPGMSLRLVQVLSPHSYFIPAHQPSYGRVSGELVDLLLDFSPEIEPEPLWHSFADSPLQKTTHGRTLPLRYCLDLDGLPLTEAMPFMQEMGRQVRQASALAPAIGLAEDKFTAQVAASISRTNHLLPVASDDHALFLASRPLGFLPLEKEAQRRLQLLGIQTLGQFAELPLSALQEQFGSEVKAAHRLAQGHGYEPVHSLPTAKEETVSRSFDDPLDNHLALTAVITEMVQELNQRLQTAVRGGRPLHLSILLENGIEQQKIVHLPQPTKDPLPITTAFQAVITGLNLNCGVTAVTLTIADLEPAIARQLSLFRQTAVTPQLQQTAHNLATKYPHGRFLQPSLTEPQHPLPEKRFALRPFAYDPALA